MKPKFRTLRRSSIIFVASLCAATSGHAANETWSATPTDANWATTNNWVAVAVPGETYVAGNTVNNDIATFDSAITTFGGSLNPVLVDLNRHLGGMTYDTANAGAYVIGGSLLKVSHNGAIQLTPLVPSAQTLTAALEFRLPANTNGVYSFRNNATASGATLTFNGTVTSAAASSRPVTLNLEGSNTGINEITNSLSHGGGQKLDVVKADAGTWVLSGINDFGSNASSTNAGSATVNGGKLMVKNNAALSTNSTANAIGVAINATGTLEINGAGLVMDNGLSLNLNTGGTIQSVGSNATNGRINVGTATSTSVTISAVGAAEVFTVGNGANDFTGGSATSIVNIGGAGTVLFAQSSVYAGGISIGNGSTLQINSDAALGAATSGNLTFVGNGKLKIGSSAIRNPTVLSLNSSSATSVIETGFTGISILTVNTPAATISTYSGILQNGTGTLALTKSGLGTLTLNGTNLYTGATTVNGGGTLNLDFSAPSAPTTDIISPSSALVLGSGTRGILNLTGKASTANTQTFASLAIGAGSNQINYSPGAAGTTGVTITAAVSPGINTQGTLRFGTTGTTTLTGTPNAAILVNAGGNPYANYGTDDWAATSGGIVGAAAYTSIAAGNFTAGVNHTVTGTFSTGTAIDMASLRFADLTGQTVTLTGAGTWTARGILVAATAGTSAINGSTAFIRVATPSANNNNFNIIQNSANDFTIGANLSNGTSSRTISLVKSGTGRLILSNAGNGFTAGTYANNGVLSISSNGNLGAVATGAAVTLNGGNLEATSTLALDNAGVNVRNIAVSSASGLYAGAGTTLTATGVVSGAGALNINPSGGTYVSSGNTITDTGTVILGGLNSLTGNIEVSAGVLVGSLSNNFVNPTTSALGNPQTAGRSINVNNGGTLRFNAGDVLGGATSTIVAGLVVNAGGSVTNTAGVFNTLGPVTLNGSTLTGLGGAIPGNQMYRFSGGVTIGGSAASTISGSGTNAGYHLGTNTPFAVNDATSSSATDLTVSGVLTNQTDSQAAAAGGFTKTGAGTMTLSGLNTYTGNTSVQGGTLVLADNAGLTFKIGASGVTNSISGTGTPNLTLDGDFTLDLSDPAAAVNGSSWVLVNVPTFAANPFSASFTVITAGFTEATNVWTKVDGAKTWTFTESTGTLSLALAGYSGWAATHAGGQTADLDFDNDGTKNGLEYFMNSAAGFTANPTLNSSNTITWPNGGNIAPGAYGTEFVVQTSNNLATWVDVPAINLASNTTTLLSYTLTGAAPRFVRLKVSPN